MPNGEDLKQNKLNRSFNVIIWGYIYKFAFKTGLFSPYKTNSMSTKYLSSKLMMSYEAYFIR